MTTKPNDGGPAFARPIGTVLGRFNSEQSGMSLRQYFSGQALSGIMANKVFIAACVDMAEEDKTTPEVVIAQRAIKIADALIAELSKETP